MLNKNRGHDLIKEVKDNLLWEESPQGALNERSTPQAAYQIVKRWQEYLRRQRIRQAQSRRIKRKEQIEALMNFIDAKLNKDKGLNQAKLQLINC